MPLIPGCLLVRSLVGCLRSNAAGQWFLSFVSVRYRHGSAVLQRMLRRWRFQGLTFGLNVAGRYTSSECMFKGAQFSLGLRAVGSSMRVPISQQG